MAGSMPYAQSHPIDVDLGGLRADENGVGRLKGRFMFGGRRRAPWEGYGAHEEQDEDEADVHAS